MKTKTRRRASLVPKVQEELLQLALEEKVVLNWTKPGVTRLVCVVLADHHHHHRYY